MAQDDERAFAFRRVNPREPKPRRRGITEIRGPYYTPMGKRYLSDVLETAGAYVDALKFAGGSFAIMPRRAVRELIELAHQHDVAVSTGGLLERVLSHGPAAGARHLPALKALGLHRGRRCAVLPHAPRAN